MTPTVLTGLVAVLMAVGMVGIVVPVLPGLGIVWGATVLWAVVHPDHRAWLVVGLSTLLYAAGLVMQYLFPGRRLKTAGVGTTTLVLAGVLAVVGFFVVPVVGLVLGFVLGVFLAEASRHRSLGTAWASTVHALKAVALSMGIELTAGFTIVLTWLFGVFLIGAGG